MPLPVRVLTEMPENLKLTGAIAEALQRAGLEAGARFERESIRSAPLRFDWDVEMTQFYQPPLDGREEDPFVRDGDDKLIRRSYWLDLSDPCHPHPPAYRANEPRRLPPLPTPSRRSRSTAPCHRRRRSRSRHAPPLHPPLCLPTEVKERRRRDQAETLRDGDRSGADPRGSERTPCAGYGRCAPRWFV
jgi:hypothetical protein